MFIRRRSDIRPIQAASARGDLISVITLIGILAPDERIIDVSCGIAIKHGGLHVARHLFDIGASMDAVFYEVMQARSIPVFELLAEYGLNLKARHHDWSQVLPRCVDDEPLVRWLLDHGADPNVGRPANDLNARTMVSNSGQVLEYAAARSTPAVFDLLLERVAKLEYSLPLHSAAAVRVGRIPMMKHLLELGVDINDDAREVRYKHGGPLNESIWWGNVENMRFLLENGANPHMNNAVSMSINLAERLAESSPTQSRKILDVIKSFTGPA